LHSDRADLNVTIIDVLAVGAFGIAAAGEFGHLPLKRGRPPVRKLSIPGVQEAVRLPRVVGVDEWLGPREIGLVREQPEKLELVR
jgi:hypothetical protein